MLKVMLFSIVSIFLLSGCSSKGVNTSKYSVTEPTDYAMSCDSLLNEIKAIKAKINDDESFLESMLPSYLKNKEELTDNDILVLSERKKSLQLIYTLKEAKKECRTLTINDTQDTQETNEIVKVIKDVKDTTSEVINEFTN